MFVAKQVADLITSTRVLIALCLGLLGFIRGAAGLPLAAWLMILDWFGDMVDGRIARRSRVQYRTWIGDHDLEVDMAVSLGLLVYLLQAGYVNFWIFAGYILLWCLFFWRNSGILRSFGMLFQAPIYGWFIWIALRDAPGAGWTIVIFLLAVVMVTWPYFPKVVVAGFFAGFRKGD